MSIEKPESIGEQPLVHFYEQMSEEDKNIIDAEILNVNNIPVESFKNITDHEEARRIMGRLRQYLELKKTNSKDDIKNDAKEIASYLDKKIEESLDY